ncbi:MFS transporter [Streptomyces pseudovenezuelae]|uniref:EmrB/QacA subfamily drug resistance transporter n=1 Tax=Streptomyces pseudovenezuelae TaxID=67350 RepID=A0ABT6LA89_9ACTN|nr:MFS transporter [Streptomyces pseudovenezuelae]MDH6213233.1 EmrB/QacA subfamily drug resistance transporter [Streptomyces pseudovenezuelae]
MRTWGPLTAVCLGTFMLLLDVTIAVVALPDMARSLHASLSDLQWVMDGYALALAALLLGVGAAADILGRRRVHVVGVVVFATASLLCGLATGPGMLVAARGVQGLGAAAMFATTLPLLGSIYQGRRRSVALGVWGAVSGAAAAVGPVLGGLLTDGPGWRWIFYVNLPVSVVAVWLTLRVVPESHGSRERKVDWAGTVTFAAFAAALTYGAVRAGQQGWSETGTLVALGAAVVALAGFLAVELRGADPLLDPRLFLKPAFSGVMVGALAFNAAAFSLLAYDSIWLQTMLGMSPVRGGLVFLWLSLASFVVAAAGGRLLHGVSARITVGGGLLVVGAGQFCMAFLGAGSTASALVPGLVLVGVGTGLVSPGIAGAALAAVPQERAGMAGGAVNTFRQLGYALGIALYGTVLTSRMQDTLPHDAAHALAGGAAGALRGAFSEHALRSAFASGLNTAAVLAGVTAAVAGVLVLALVRTPRTTAGQPPKAPRTTADAASGRPR